MTWATLKHSGIVTDLPPEEVPLEHWTDGDGVQFVLGVTRRASGFTRFADPVQVPPLFAINVVVEAISYWLYCSEDAVWVTDGVDHFDITPAGGLTLTLPNEWTGCLINGLVVLNNTHDEPIYWDLDTSNPCSVLPGWPPGATCRAMRSHKYHLFALAVEDGGNLQERTLWWSSSAAPGVIPQEWVPAVTNDAGDMPLADTAGAIIDGLSLRDVFVVYTSSSVYMLNYVAGQYVYTQRKLYLADGIAARNCVVENGGMHYVFTGNDVLGHDGQNARSLVVRKVKERLGGSIDPDRLERCWVALSRINSSLKVGYCSTGSVLPNHILSIDLQTGDCGTRTVTPVAHMARGFVVPGAPDTSWDSDDNPWDSDPSYWDEQDFSPTDDSLLACCPDVPALYAWEVGDTADGAPVNTWLERLSMQLHEGIERVLVRRAAMRFEGEPGDQVQVRVGGQAFFGQPITWSDPVNITIGGVQVVDVLAEGRLISLRVQASTQRAWRLHSYKLEFDTLGDY